MAMKTVNPLAKAGAEAFIDLINKVNAHSEADLERYADVVECGRDVRDYRAMAQIVAGELHRNLFAAHPEHAQGFLRALTDLLCMEGDGCGPDDDWDPIKNTAAAYGEDLEVDHA